MDQDPDRLHRMQEQGATGEDQDEVVRFLLDPAVYGDAGPVELIETHAAYVFLCGEQAWKMKRAVKYDYLDFSRLDQRHEMLLRELELNHPNAPQIYKDVVALTRTAEGGLAVEGEGPVVEWVLRMWRFPVEAEFSLIAERGELSDALAGQLGRALAEYHGTCEPRDEDGARLIDEIIEELRLAYETMGPELGERRIEAFLSGCRQMFGEMSDLLSMRSRTGHVRRCHGDLHLCNIVLIDGKPVPFDALEFSETLGTCDVLYDLAFLVMDLRHEGLARAANLVLNGYLYTERGMEDPGVTAVPLFLAIRAGIRAMVDVQTDRACGKPGRSNADARRYLDDAIAALAPPPPRLIAVGGRSGSGKTSVSVALAPLFGAAPGAVHIRSDLERKAIFCVDPLTHLPPDSYARTVNRQVHERLRIRAETILRAGHSVVIDAVFITESERVAIADLATRLGVPFDGIWLETDAAHLLPRVAARTDDASDADETVVRMQLASDPGVIDWFQIDASGTREETIAAAVAHLGLADGAA